MAGGARLIDGDPGAGFFVAPTVLVDVEDGIRVAREEIFGPVACVLPPAGTAAGVTPSSGTRRRP